MSKELDEKWRDLVADGKAKWMPGMLGPDGFRILTVRQDSRGFQLVSRGCGWTAPSLQSDFLPDWTDPATLGCLLALVREAWGDSDIYFGSSLSTKRKRWSWVMGGGDCIGQGDTEAEALLATLEAAP